MTADNRDDVVRQHGSSARLRPVAILAALMAVVVLTSGCALVARAAGKIVLDIGTEIIVQAGADYLKKILSSNDANGDPTLIVSYTNAAGEGLGTNYAVNRTGKITTQSVTIKNAHGAIHVVGNGDGLTVTVDNGATATIEINLTGDDHGGPAASTATDQAATIDGVIRWSGRSRKALFAALADLGTCRNIPGATAALQTVAADRAHQIDALGKVDVSALPNGGSLRGTLVQALTFSQRADQAFVGWGAAQQSGCRQDGNYSDAMSYSRDATATKRQFVAAWKPIAATYGLPEYQETDI
jgi:hypothetical protein